MTRIIARYLSASVLRHYLLFTLVMIVLASLIEFLENRDGLLDDPRVSMLDALRFSALSAPGIFSLLAGFLALISVLIATITLLRYSELKAMLAAGLSHGQFLRALAPAASLMLCFHFMMDNVALPRASAELREWGIGKSWKERPGATDAIWTRDGDYILSVRRLRQRDETLRDVDLFALSRSGSLRWHMSAPVARFTVDGMLFPDAVRTMAGKSRPVAVRNFRFRTELDFATLAVIAPHPQQMSLWNISRVLRQASAASHPRAVYELWFHKKLAGPLTTALAVLLLAPLVQRLHRMGSIHLLLLGLAGGFVYFVADAVLTGLSEAGMTHPVIAAWAMPGLLGLLIVLIHAADATVGRSGQHAMRA